MWSRTQGGGAAGPGGGAEEMRPREAGRGVQREGEKWIGGRDRAGEKGHGREEGSSAVPPLLAARGRDREGEVREGSG